MTRPRSTAKKTSKGRKAAPKAGGEASPLVSQPHGGALWQGPAANPVAGPGRPPDTVRAAYRELGATKGLKLIDKTLDGEIVVSLVGKCPKCKYEGAMPDGLELAGLVKQVRATVDQQLKANEQALKYGLGTKDELDIANHPLFLEAARAYGEVHDRALDVLPPAQQQLVRARLVELMTPGTGSVAA